MLYTGDEQATATELSAGLFPYPEPSPATQAAALAALQAGLQKVRLWRAPCPPRTSPARSLPCTAHSQAHGARVRAASS